MSSSTSLLDALNNSLDRLQAGQSIQDCLLAHPGHAAQLRPLLEAHRQALAALPDQAEIAAAKARGRARVLAALQGDSAVSVQRAPSSRILRFPARLLSLAAAVMLIFAVVIVYAQNTLPGDALYGIKRLSENVLLPFDAGGTLREQFAGRRIDEIGELLAAGRAETVSFSGRVEVQNDDRWMVSGLVLQVPPGTPGAQTATIGDQIDVRAATTPTRTLLALSIELADDDAQPAVPTSTVTVTLTPSVAPSLTPTTTETHTPSPTWTATLPTQTLTRTPTPTPSATLTDVPSPTPPQTCIAQLPPDWVTYHVQSGDTLSALAVATASTVDELRRVNCLEESLIVTGQLLFVPIVPVFNTPVATSAPPITNPPAPQATNPPPSPDEDDDLYDDDDLDDDDWDDDWDDDDWDDDDWDDDDDD